MKSLMITKGIVLRKLAVAAVSLSAMAISVPAVAGDLDIGGVYYQKLVNMKDVIADILPPPAYIIESYLVTLQILDESEKGNKAKVDELITYGEKLSNGRSDKGSPFPGYFERIDAWKKDLDDKTPQYKAMKNLITKTSVLHAKKFFELRDKKFIPAVKAGKLADAVKIMRSELRPAYEAHRKEIDLLVAAATKDYLAAEKEANDRLAKGETGGEVKVKGKLYNRIIQMKDLIADVLPPPCYIIESLLVSMEMIDDVEANNGKPSDRFKKLTETSRLLKDGDSSKGENAGFTERQAYWAKNLSDKTIPEKKAKDLMTSLSATPAKSFFSIHDSKLVPALQAGKVADAKKILRDEMLPLYTEHRKAIDELVSRADRVYKQFESEVAQQLSK